MASRKNKYVCRLSVVLSKKQQTSVTVIDRLCSISLAHSASVCGQRSVLRNQAQLNHSSFSLSPFSSFQLLMIVSFVEFRYLKSTAAAVCPMNLFTLAPDKNVSMHSPSLSSIDLINYQQRESPTSSQTAISPMKTHEEREKGPCFVFADL